MAHDVVSDLTLSVCVNLIGLCEVLNVDKRDKYALIFIIINILFHKCSFQKLNFGGKKLKDKSQYKDNYLLICINIQIFSPTINHSRE